LTSRKSNRGNAKDNLSAAGVIRAPAAAPSETPQTGKKKRRSRLLQIRPVCYVVFVFRFRPQHGPDPASKNGQATRMRQMKFRPVVGQREI
jgi:hypothetical protein